MAFETSRHLLFLSSYMNKDKYQYVLLYNVKADYVFMQYVSPNIIFEFRKANSRHLS